MNVRQLVTSPQGPLSRAAYARAVQRVLGITLGLNVAVSLAKVVAGYASGSLALVSDGAHSAIDSLNNVVGLVAVSVAARDADAGHPYGHSKFETLAAFGLSGLLFLTCFQVTLAALKRLVGSTPAAPQASSAAFAVVLVTLAVNIGVARYEARRGRELGSDFLAADAAHTRSDVLVSATVLASLLMVRFGLPRVDAALSLVIAAFIGRIGYRVFQRTLPVLVDASAVEEARLQAIVHSVPGVVSAHAMRSRRSGPTVFIEMHILVSPSATAEAAHATSEAVERALEAALGPTTATIHIETTRDCGR